MFNKMNPEYLDLIMYTSECMATNYRLAYRCDAIGDKEEAKRYRERAWNCRHAMHKLLGHRPGHAVYLHSDMVADELCAYINENF